MVAHYEPPLRLILDGDALAHNWRWLAKQSGAAACGAAIKADGYGLGARAVVERLTAAGCTDFFVATWGEADALGVVPGGAALSVLHGVREEDMAVALASRARPVLNTPAMIARWKAAAPDRPCDVMIDTGMNRLGLSLEDACSGLLDGLVIETLMSHLACADEDNPMNVAQRDRFMAVSGLVKAPRYSLANSAGICLGKDYAFDLTRPGLALYGGIPRAEAMRAIRPVVGIEAQILQVRKVNAGDSVGYGAIFTATKATRVAILNLGYADGYLRSFAGHGAARRGRAVFPLRGRVSMDLIACDIGKTDVGEGDWLQIDYPLESAAKFTGLSQYELLTGLGSRYQRRWID